ncbi:hypothetical protein ACRQ5D_33830 [Mucilaginibacter sp. P25]|uniref:hypothetical protein n=1 Tax=Mucilaginibacter sp. P25 TaxID=3423945 RepID=UPI003D792A5E
MDTLIHLIQTIFYPFWYFLVLGIIHELAKLTTIFFVAGGRLKSFHVIEKYWIYLLVTLFCLIIGIVVGYGDLTVFCRWFICAQLAALLGIHNGYDKALGMGDLDLKEIEDDIDDDDE